MNIHEYQAKDLLSKYGVKVPEGYVAFSPSEAESVAKKLDTKVWVVKAQIHAGGRGKAGGVKVLKDITLVKPTAESMLGMKLVTQQTGPEGKIVKRVYIEAGSDIKKEYYFSIVIDRNTNSVVLIASTEGGMDIEEVAAKSPEKIIKVVIDTVMGLQDFHIGKIISKFKFIPAQSKKFAPFVKSLYKAFIGTDASQVEINPLIETNNGEFVALDAKFNFDPNALYRHSDIALLGDPDEREPLEVQAANFDLNYVKMDGNIGCMVNGAGLAMATMDIIQLHGGKPANFLDVGGSATTEKVTEAFKIITADHEVKGILINIFGGIMRCDVIANGVVTAAKEVGIKVPVVVRLEGTNAEKGKEIINNSGLAVESANDLIDAAEKIVKAIGVK
ncbi:MAG: ADP-forming succinate--CoA ligase subunit beta [Candidatus Midichloria sp.]|nr:ADP-forming succinate--CoA ligase subunit beta [Candidatus Midichloria sp.]